MSTNSKNINVEHIAKLAAIELTEKEKDISISARTSSFIYSSIK